MKTIVRSAVTAAGVCALSVLFAQTPVPPAAAPVSAQPAVKPPTPHPLDPLAEDEIKGAVSLLKSEGKSTHYMLYSFIGLQEPPKDAVLAFKADDLIARRVKVVCYDTKNNATIEGVVNVTDKKVESWVPIPGVQAPTGDSPDSVDGRLTERIVRADSRWQAAVKKRGFDPADVGVGTAPVRGYLDRSADGNRYTVGLSYFEDLAERAELQGLVVLVNITKRSVEWVRDEPGPSPRTSADDYFDPDQLGKPRDALKPLTITQPDGQNFQMDGNEVRWQRWRFRIGQDPRVGLVLYTVGFEDQGKLRSVMYRGSLSELYVPYGDPTWFLVHWFDAGDYGLASGCQSPLKPMNDVPENAKLLPVVMFRPNGTPKTIKNALAVYERDGGILWRHGETSRRARDLVVGSIYQAGNYDYGLNWVFHQDGTLQVEVEATGFMETRNVGRKSDADMADEMGSAGTLVAPNIAAVNHQHFFSFRLDMDIDGPGNNSLYEMNVEALPAGDGNKDGNGFVMKDTLLATEQAAQRSLNASSARCWKVVNPSVKNTLGQGSAYELMPSGNAVPYSLPGSYLSTVGAFARHHLWATPYAPNEMYAAGTYVRDGQPADGLPKWTAADRSIAGRDVVLWYTVGLTHIPRAEEWPIMNTHRTGFMLMPAGFFSKNPALDVAETKPKDQAAPTGPPL